MPRSKSKKSSSKIKLRPDEAARILNAGAKLADAVKDVLESRGAYSEEFLAGLRRSDQAERGELIKINSLEGLGD